VGRRGSEGGSFEIENIKSKTEFSLVGVVTCFVRKDSFTALTKDFV